MTERCHRCRRSLGLVPDDEIRRHRESLGFGAANDRMRSFCSSRCRAIYRGSDRVIDETWQTTLPAWTADGFDPDDPYSIVYSV